MSVLERGSSVATSVRAHGAAKLARLCSAVGLDEVEATALRLFDLLSEGWGDHRVDAPAWGSDITDDHSPYEFSLAFDGDRCELRFLIEAQRLPTTPRSNSRSNWEAGLEGCVRLGRELGVPLERLRLVEELFEPVDPAASFGLWHAVCLRPAEPPDIKVYLNPHARGSDAAALVEQALARLGLGNTWRFLSQQVLKPRDVFAYFSLDLSPQPSARVKIYLAHPGLTSDEAERLMATDAGYDPGVATRLCRDLLGGDGPFERRPLGTCLAFTEGSDARPYTTTLHLPLRAYLDNDRDTAERIYPYLAPAGRERLRAALTTVAERPLDAGNGLIQWVSLRRRDNQNRVTVYISPEVYRTAPTRSRAE